MAPRANWKGYLRLSLVSCPIALYPASSLSEKVSFNRLSRKTGNRLKQQKVDSETGEVVSRDDPLVAGILRMSSRHFYVPRRTESSLLATTSLGECGVMAEELKRSGLVCGASTLPRYDSSIGVDEMKRIMLTAAPVLPVLR